MNAYCLYMLRYYKRPREMHFQSTLFILIKKTHTTRKRESSENTDTHLMKTNTNKGNEKEIVAIVSLLCDVSRQTFLIYDRSESMDLLTKLRLHSYIHMLNICSGEFRVKLFESGEFR